MNQYTQRAECRLSALAFYEQSMLYADDQAAENILANTRQEDLIAGLVSLLDLVLNSWAVPHGLDRQVAVALLRATNLAIQGVEQ